MTFGDYLGLGVGGGGVFGGLARWAHDLAFCVPVAPRGGGEEKSAKMRRAPASFNGIFSFSSERVVWWYGIGVILIVDGSFRTFSGISGPDLDTVLEIRIISCIIFAAFGKSRHSFEIHA